jgi:hypothetical protein
MKPLTHASIIYVTNDNGNKSHIVRIPCDVSVKGYREEHIIPEETALDRVMEWNTRNLKFGGVRR